MKNVIERNLPLSDNYKLLSVNYISIMDGGGICENCGRLISNIATVQNDKGKTFHIGTDCAETLTVFKNDPFALMHFKDAFSEGKRIKSKIAGHLKKGNITGVRLFTCKDNDQFVVYDITRGGSAMEKLIFPEITLKYIKEYLPTA